MDVFKSKDWNDGYEAGYSDGKQMAWWAGFACGILTVLLGLAISHLVAS